MRISPRGVEGRIAFQDDVGIEPLVQKIAIRL